MGILEDQKVQQNPLSSHNVTREKVHKQVRSFVKGVQFSNLVRTGMRAEDAARRVGIDIKFGKMLNPNEIAKIKDTGQLPKSRKF